MVAAGTVVAVEAACGAARNAEAVAVEAACGEARNAEAVAVEAACGATRSAETGDEVVVVAVFTYTAGLGDNIEAEAAVVCDLAPTETDTGAEKLCPSEQFSCVASALRPRATKLSHCPEEEVDAEAGGLPTGAGSRKLGILNTFWLSPQRYWWWLLLVHLAHTREQLQLRPVLSKQRGHRSSASSQRRSCLRSLASY